MKMRLFLIMCLSIFMFIPLAVYAADDVKQFSDVEESDWYYDNVKYVCENKLMNGISDEEFAPNSAVTRAMAATILYRIDGNKQSQTLNSFSDVASSDWYFDAVTWMTNYIIADGYGNGEFGANDNITREQFIKMLYQHYYVYRLSWRYNTTNAGESVIEAEKCSDYNDVSEWAQEAVRWAAREGLINGSAGKINPQSFITRAEMAAMVERYDAWIKLIDEKYGYRYCLVMLEEKDDNGNFQGTASWVTSGTSIKNMSIMKEDKTIEGIYLDSQYTVSAEETVANDALIVYIKHFENKLGLSVVDWNDEEIASIYKVVVKDQESGTEYVLDEPARVGDFLSMLYNFAYSEKTEIPSAVDRRYVAAIYSTDAQINGSKVRFNNELLETEMNGKITRYIPYDPGYLTEDNSYFTGIFHKMYSGLRAG